MTLRPFLLVCALFLYQGPAHAMTWAELSQEITAVEGGAEGNREIILRFSEIVHMLVSYTRELRSQELPPLVCPPRGQAMNIDDLVSIVRAQARKTDAADTALVQDLLLAGFRERFPCA